MTDALAFALYLHVPWCRRVCPYCDFNVHARPSIPEDADVAAYAAEIDAWAATAPFAEAPLDSVFLGGGTPSLLSPAAVARILDHVGRRFRLRGDAEITLEANPGTVTYDSLRALRAAGVNRLSLGAQSFQPAVLARLGRDHGPEETVAAVACARRAGFGNLSLDLVFAVPDERVEDWARDLDAALALAPEHVSTYALTYEPGTPMARWRASGRIRPVDDDDEAAMGELACTTLAAAGYERYEISSHARPGFASRHNQRYWDGSSYLGIGPGAHSYAALPLPGRRWENERQPERYRAQVMAGGTAVAAREDLTPARAESDYVVTGLRRIAGVDGTAFRRRFGRSLEQALPQLGTLERDGLVVHEAGALRLTGLGLRFADSVWATLV